MMAEPAAVLAVRQRLATGVAVAWATRLLIGAAVAWMIFAGVVLGHYVDTAVPTSYVIRPLAVTALLGLLIAAFAAFAGRWAPAVALSSAATVVVLEFGLFIGLLLVGGAIVAGWTARLGLRVPIASVYTKTALTFSAAFLLIAVVRAGLYIDPPGHANSAIAGEGNSLYLVLLDGYPRGDTLSEDLGIDNGSFFAQLTERRFDIYDDARSSRVYTELTLTSMFNASESAVPPVARTATDKRTLRRQLDEARLPVMAMDAGYEYVVIDSPIGHVTFGSGAHIRHGGLNNFEEQLLARSPLGKVVAAATPYWLTASLRAHLDDSISSVVELAEPGRGRLVLAHLMAPHLPFLYADDGSDLPIPPYWPAHQLFGSTIEDIGVSFDYYREMYPGHLRVINSKVLEMVDAMLVRDPDAVIVLFSDHGARYSYDVPEEWHRSFLAARTPGNANLFGESPTTTQILCDLFVAYLYLPCQ